MNARHPLVRRAALIVTTVAAVSTTACDQPEDRAEVALSQSGVNLRSDVLAGTDVAGFVYTLTPIDCATGEANNAEGVVQTARDLENLLLPGGHPGFVDGPFAATSGHLFSDAFQALPPGCYGVIAQPVDADGRPSVDCAPAAAPNVAVAPERTTEVLLISQCDGDAIGALDVIAALNHAPEIVDLTYDPSKFTCGESTRICITVDDPDNDPLQIRAEGPEGVQVVLGRPVVDEDGRTVVCADVTVPGPGQYDIDWLVYDTMNGEGGRAAIVPIETQLPEGQTSHAHLVTPVHAMDAEACLCACPEGFALNDAGDACERFVEADAVFNGATLDVCEGDDRNEYGALGARFPGGLTVTNNFFGNGWDNPAGRLNEVGIWVCGASPLREWIGFSACLHVEEAGEYVLGIAGDDASRLLVDGQQVYFDEGQQNFWHWSMVPIVLTPGAHVIELQGRDQGVAATLGAEIYGPFPAGSTADDAAMAGLDYEGNILWSTRDQLGGVFDTGANSGYSCPDGTSLNLCGEAPACTGHEIAECL